MNQHARRTGLAITNPLVLYRSLLATKQIAPDPAQHRLALHLQKLYERLKDYEPSVQYGHRLRQLNRAVGERQPNETASASDHSLERKGIWTSLLAEKERRDGLALTRVLTSQEEALRLASPKGLMLHGEVGTGKSLLVDLFADSLPSRKKRRYHYNTFMLETITKLEQLRLARASNRGRASADDTDEHSLLWLARELIQTSPILFLDEFQLPDRAASKIVSTLMTSFFQLGGVLIATSNRMPEELAKAAGIEYAPPPSRFQSLKLWTNGLNRLAQGKSDSMFAGQGEFASFLELLRARCDMWELDGTKDYRRNEAKGTSALAPNQNEGTDAVGRVEIGSAQDGTIADAPDAAPTYYVINQFRTHDPQGEWKTYLDAKMHQATGVGSSLRIPWEPSSFRVYGRRVPVPRHFNGISCWTFTELCGSRLGPADYISLASTYHTVILTDVPLLGVLQKNEARRFITLLDALYESRCKLLVSAAAGPDHIFFPEKSTWRSAGTGDVEKPQGSAETKQGGPDSRRFEEEDSDAVHAETFSEAYQDVAAPFRPNISSYDGLAEDALEDDPPNRARRAAGVTERLADEQLTSQAAKVDFSQTSAFTGEDERFAFKRARSRLWEMCSQKWWARGEGEATVGSWWRPLDRSSRRWEGTARDDLSAYQKDGEEELQQSDGGDDLEKMFQHGSNPFRGRRDAPPKISWTHVWGTMRWGARAGNWGKGVEGVEERKSGKK